jgi:hypothetical protein
MKIGEVGVENTSLLAKADGYLTFICRIIPSVGEPHSF